MSTIETVAVFCGNLDKNIDSYLLGTTIGFKGRLNAMIFRAPNLSKINEFYKIVSI